MIISQLQNLASEILPSSFFLNGLVQSLFSHVPVAQDRNLTCKKEPLGSFKILILESQPYIFWFDLE